VVNVLRRSLVLTAPAVLAGAAIGSGCAQGVDSADYVTLSAQTWRTGPLTGLTSAELGLELVRYATLAPSSHNTQCWKFALEGQTITILPDLSRRCQVVDPDDHHVFVSLGCATENLVQAALALGYMAEANLNPAESEVRVDLAPTPAQVSPLFQAIPARQSTRADYDGKPLSNRELDLLQRAGTSGSVQMLLLTDRPEMERVLDYVVQANAAQIADPAFVKELKTWIRFNAPEAVRARDGLFSASSGNPAIPSWMGEFGFEWYFTLKGEDDKYARQVRSSSGIAVFVGQAPSKARWVEVGRCYERFALQATALGIRNAMLNQAVEVGTVRPQLATTLGLAGQRPDLVVRFGRGPTMPASLRRPVRAVMV
jgi:hypothetical protein